MQSVQTYRPITIAFAQAALRRMEPKNMGLPDTQQAIANYVYDLLSKDELEACAMATD